MKSVFLFFLFIVFYSLPSFASSAGDACTTSGSVERQGGQTLICNGSVWKEAEQIDTAGRTLIQMDAKGAVEICNSDKSGRLSYNTATDAWTYCNGSSWLTFQRSACVGPVGCENIGDMCTDGSVFAGCGGSDYHQIVVTRCDAGEAWDSFSDDCVGTATNYRFGDSVSNTNARATGVTNPSTGQANTTALTNGVENGTGDGKSDAGVQPHNAAAYCDTLSIHGHTDWFLPARFELYTIFMNRVIIGYFNADSYWSSTEYSATTSYYQNFSNYRNDTGNKSSNGLVRCARLP